MNTLKKEVIIFGMILLSIISLVYAIPLINFTNPTPSNNTHTTNTSAEINISIVEPNLKEVKYNWGGTNYTMYNNSLVLMMNFDNVSALGENETHIFDISGNGNNGTGYGGVIINSSGKYNGGVHFDGIDDYIEIPDSDSLDMTDRITVAFWMKSTPPSSDSQIIIGKAFSSTDYKGDWWFEAQNTNSLVRFYLTNSNGTYSGIDMPSIALDGSWHYLTGTYNGSLQSFYIDGYLYGSSSWSGTVLNSNQSIYIGKAFSGAGGYGDVWFDGQLDELKIWNRSLSSDEVYQQYISNLNKFNSTRWYLYVNQSKNATNGLTDGTYTYFSSATNSSGSENITGTRTLTVDTTFPTITINSPANNTNSSDSGLDINYTASDTNRDSCWYNKDAATANTTLANCVNITSIIWNDGPHNITVWVNDSAGNENSSSVTFTIDTTSPAWENNKTNLTIDTASGNAVYFNVTLNDTNPGQYVFSWYNGTDWANDTAISYTNGQEISVTKTISVSSGDINWTWYFNDTFGNLNQTDIWSVTLGAVTSAPSEEIEPTTNLGGGGSYLLESSDGSNGLEFRTFLFPEKSKTVKIKSDKKTSITELEIKSKNWLTGNIYIVPYNYTPDFCSINYKGDYVLYNVLNINATFNSSLIEEARLRMDISKKWIYKNNVSTIKVVECSPFYRELKISYVNETTESGIYDIYSNGISTLAILGTLSTNKNSRGNDDKKDWVQKTNRYSLLKIFLIIALILILFGIIVLLVKHRIYLKEKIHTKFFDFEFRIGKK